MCHEKLGPICEDRPSDVRKATGPRERAFASPGRRAVVGSDTGRTRDVPTAPCSRPCSVARSAGKNNVSLPPLEGEAGRVERVQKGTWVVALESVFGEGRFQADLRAETALRDENAWPRLGPLVVDR